MSICVLGAGTIGTSLVQSLKTKCGEIHLGTLKEGLEPETFIKDIQFHKYGQIHKVENVIEISKCVITTRIDLLPVEQKKLIFDDIKSLASNGCEFINLSSVSVYGSSKFPRNEFSELNPINSYGLMKMNIELDLIKIIPNVKLTNLRVANLYGMRGFPDLTNTVFSHLRNNREMTIPNNTNLRDFIFYKDLEVFLEDWIFNRFYIYGALNFASGKSVSIEDWVNLISKVTGKEAYYRKDFSEQLAYSVIDNMKLKETWNYPLTDMNQGLVEYFDTLENR